MRPILIAERKWPFATRASFGRPITAFPVVSFCAPQAMMKCAKDSLFVCLTCVSTPKGTIVVVYIDS